ncbi:MULTISPECIES: family 78 glycoside hydrolase catalytic domain [unclassified Streptomyces]|uniref:family 78 glycoside hydrolase catalytic domain n=1 Tax=unclassified Streptomyces TaxID=2593676 RepID=UPI0036E16853
MTLDEDWCVEGPAGRVAVTPTPLDLRVDGRVAREPALGERGVNLAIRTHPRLSWRPDNSARTAFEAELTDSAGSRVWASGPVASASGTSVTVETVLPARQRYRWAVRLRSAHGVWSDWARSELETGPAHDADWTAPWISAPATSRLRRPFTLPGAVECARLYLTGQGLVRAELNGSPVNAGHLDPTRTDAGRALYRCYDVTDLLRAGVNELDFVLGLGEWGRTGLDPRVRAEVEIWHADGSRSTIGCDAQTLVSSSRIVEDDPFYLERHCVAAEAAHGWSALDPSCLRKPGAGPEAPPSVVEVDPTPPARIVALHRPVEVHRRDGIRLYDVGTNIAGRSRIEILGALPAGTVVHVVHGEHVAAGGRLDTTNLMMPFDEGRRRQVVEWVSAGVAGEVVEAWFAYHGFRYIEIGGLPGDAEITVTAAALHTDLTPAGTVRTDDPLIGTLLERAERTLLNNVHGVPEDCPTREQAAWTGDTASVAEYELAAFDTENFLAKWIRDLLTSQGEDGALPAIAPDVRFPRLPADPVWGAALHRILLGHWLHYGDARLVRETLPALRRWADFQLSLSDESGVIARSPISYGHDWLALEQTPPPVHHSAATIDCLVALARLEEELGDRAAAATRRRQAGFLRTAAKARFHDSATGVFANGSQGSYAAAIDAGILTGADAEEAARRIERDVRARGNRASGGFATTRTIVRALTATGRSHVVADILRQPAEPGVGAMLVSGPGTFWECWWIDPANTGTGSLDHVGLGGVFAGWVWTGLAGITPTSGGYRSFRVAPQFVAGVDRLSLRTQTAAGTVGFAYRVVGSSAAIELEVPEGVVAVLRIGGLPDREFTGGRHEVTVDVRRPAATPAPATAEAWAPPSIAPRSADVTGADDLLARAIEDGLLRAADGSGFELLDGLNCMPIPHAQPAGPLARILATRAGGRPTVRVEPARPLDASEATFFYALVDLCDERSARGARPVIRLLSADGSDIRAAADSWPAGWNRVAVDTGGWAGRSSITAIEVSLLPLAPGSDDLLMPPADDRGEGFHLGGLGFSTARRTW